VFLSILSCVLPYLMLARFNSEFPSLVDGAIGLCLSTLLAKGPVGPAPHAHPEAQAVSSPKRKHSVRAFAPYVLLMVILVLTRVRFLPLRAWLNAEATAWTLDWGSVGQLSVSVALVFKL
jgi:lactate permease